MTPYLSFSSGIITDLTPAINGARNERPATVGSVLEKLFSILFTQLYAVLEFLIFHLMHFSLQF
ncbi:hypothetical protein ATG98_3806 [Marinobacter sp. LV10R520-4]|nr:hypothetical protein ATG98_3806 [Marinobacter sp. LV10R520-4]